jgi:hypothetical protein
VVEVDWVVGAGCEEGLSGGVFQGKVRTWSNGAGRFGEGEGAVGYEFYGRLAWLEEGLGEDEGTYPVGKG